MQDKNFFIKQNENTSFLDFSLRSMTGMKITKRDDVHIVSSITSRNL